MTGPQIPALPGLVLWTAGLTWLAQDNPFFWDTVQLGSKHAHHFYENSFRLPWLLPPALDSGHPPTFGLYLALCWKLFGKTLAVSHWAMFPFLLVINYLLLKIGQSFSNHKTALLLPLLVWADPVFAAQAILISPDIPLVAFLLLGLWGIISRNPLVLGIAIFGLGFISMRGMMVAFALYVWIVASAPEWRWYALFQKSRPFLPGGFAVLGWLIYHYYHTGWVGFHADSPWSGSFEPVSTKGFLRNLLVCIWRMLDFGRIFILLILSGLCFSLLKKRYKLPIAQYPRIREMGLLCLCLAFVLFLPAMGFKSLSAHRYLLPLFLALSMLVWLLIESIPERPTLRVSLTAIAILGLATGNFWQYPEHISTGWDATLSHWPYYQLRREAISFMQNNNIEPRQVGTAFPEIGQIHHRDLSYSKEEFKNKNLDTDTYILWSNIMNDYSDQERARLQTDWQSLMEWEKGAVRIILYFNPNRLISTSGSNALSPKR
jgi:hypothetical protein